MLATAVTAATMLGGFSSPFCVPPPLPPDAPAIEQQMRDRGSYGFRADRAYVERLEQRSAKRVEGYGFPITARERRYLLLRDRIDLGRRATRYLRARRDLSGGVSIEDGRRSPYVLVRLTRDRATHTRALRRLTRAPLRTTRVKLSARQLGLIQDRIDWDAAAADGYQVEGTGPDLDANAVEIEVATEFSRALKYFRARYGPRIHVTVTRSGTWRPECRAMDHYHDDGRLIAVEWNAGGGALFQRVETTEHPDRVEVQVLDLGYTGMRTLEIRPEWAWAWLREPLGDRRVVDARTGEPLVRARSRPPRAR